MVRRKTKPTQTAVRQMRTAGISRDIIIARSSVRLDEVRKEKKKSRRFAMSRRATSSPPPTSALSMTCQSTEKDHLGQRILERFGLRRAARALSQWRAMVRVSTARRRRLRLALSVNIYSTGDFMLSDSYLSVIEAVKHTRHGRSGVSRKSHGWVVRLTSEIPKPSVSCIRVDAIVVPGGFGGRGVEGKNRRHPLRA